MGNAGKKGEGPVEPNGPGRPVQGTQAGLFGEEGHTPEPKKLIKGVYPFDEVAAAFQKEIRRGDVRAAMYWGHLLYAEAPYDAWKRLLVAAAEDVGLAAPEAVEKVCGLALAWRICREKSYYVSPHHFSMAVMLLCAAPKDNRVEDLQTLVLDRIKESDEDEGLAADPRGRRGCTYRPRPGGREDVARLVFRSARDLRRPDQRVHAPALGAKTRMGSAGRSRARHGVLHALRGRRGPPPVPGAVPARAGRPLCSGGELRKDNAR